MRYFLIADNVDTQVGMRLAGIEGVVVHGSGEAEKAVRDAAADETIGVLLINEKSAALCKALISELKLTAHRPLVVEIPDRHGTGRAPDSITAYIKSAIGISL